MNLFRYIKNNILSVGMVFTFFLSGNVFAEKIPTFRVLLDPNSTYWVAATSTFTPWKDVGAHYDCGIWNPDPASINFGQAFLQNRPCKQNQERTETLREYDDYTKTYRDVDTKLQTRTINATEYRTGTGTYQNWVSYASSFNPDWTDEGSPTGHGTWAPGVSNQTANFTQTRTYLQPQYRMEQEREQDTITLTIRDKGDLIRRTGNDTRSENRIVSVSASSWVNTTATNHAEWAPVAAAQTADYSQTRGFTQNQDRTWTYTADGATIGTRTESQALAGQNESRNVVVTATPWVNVGAHFDCGTWSPDPTTVGYGQTFTQTRSCSQLQDRNFIHKVAGSTIYTAPVQQTITETETQSSVGELENWVPAASTFTAWTDSGAGTNYGTWSPAVAAQTASFTQTQSYDQPQTRYEQQREQETYSLAFRDVGAPILRSQSVSRSNSRTVTATAGSWSNTSATGYSAWSPAYGSQTANYTQTRTYTQNQQRVWDYRVSGSSIGTYTQTQALTGQSESQSIVVTVGSWSNSGSHYSCGSWSPSASSVNYGQSFTQTRSCSQNQTRTVTHKLSGTTVHTASGSQTISETESQSATGTYQNWVAASPLYGTWSFVSYSYTAWSPAASTQTSSFTQSRTRTENQQRSVQPRQQDAVTGSYRNSGSSYNEANPNPPKTTENQTVTVTAGTPTDIGPHTSCGTWSPATNTVNQGTTFTQTRSCSTTYRTTYTFSIGGSHTVNSSGTATESQSATGTKIVYGTWQYVRSVGSSTSFVDNKLTGACTPIGQTRYYSNFMNTWYEVVEQRCQ